jgi:murein DD-endopeptidase MepM/ murein hydrolase activator NlpD
MAFAAPASLARIRVVLGLAMAAAGAFAAIPAAAQEAPPAVASPTPAQDVPANPLNPAPNIEQTLPSPAAAPDRVVLRLQRGDTLGEMLRAVNVPADDATAFIAALRRVMDIRDLRVGQEIMLLLQEQDGADDMLLVGAQIATGPLRRVSVERGADGQYTAVMRDNPLTREHVRAVGVVRASLYGAGANAGVPLGVMVEMIRAFSYDVDFQREMHPGDRFEVVYERFTDETGVFARDGAVIYAALTLNGNPRRIYRHQATDGTWDYYNDRGESVRKALLRTPINGARLTSGFGNRFHPILGYTAFHRGIDFGAGTGTPIQSAGDGRIEQMGWNGGYGNYVRVRHTGEYATAYAHMSRFVRGLRVGSSVRQGQVIGFVGATGRATGPHLHYEVIRGGRQINPLGVRFAAGRRLAGPELARFNATREETDQLIARLPVRTPEMAECAGQRGAQAGQSQPAAQPAQPAAPQPEQPQPAAQPAAQPAPAPSPATTASP